MTYNNILFGEIPDVPDSDQENMDTYEMKWQPIETAPHGASRQPDTYIMLGKVERGTVFVCTGYVNDYGAFAWWGGGMMGLTHWMPLPPHPTNTR